MCTKFGDFSFPYLFVANEFDRGYQLAYCSAMNSVCGYLQETLTQQSGSVIVTFGSSAIA